MAFTLTNAVVLIPFLARMVANMNSTATSEDIPNVPILKYEVVGTAEQRLLQALTANYEKYVRPVRNSSSPVHVLLGLTLIHIFDMDEKNQILTTNIWLDQEWYDEFLIWDAREFGGMESIRIPGDLIWVPDIVLYNNAEDYYGRYMPSRAMVYNNGRVFWPIPSKTKSTCRTDVTYFPFDSQHCYMKFGSWTYPGHQVNVSDRRAKDVIDLTNYVVSGEFDLISTHHIRREVYYTCCPDPFPDVVFFFHIRRKVLFYVYNAVLPCSMLSVLTLLVFWLPPDSGEKVTLGVTVLLAFSVFVLNIAERMPETSDSLPLIGVYLIVVMGITSVSVLMTVIVLNFHYRGPLRTKVPRWMEWLVLKKLRVLMGISFSEKDNLLVSYYNQQEEQQSPPNNKLPSYRHHPKPHHPVQVIVHPHNSPTAPDGKGLVEGYVFRKLSSPSPTPHSQLPPPPGCECCSREESCLEIGSSGGSSSSSESSNNTRGTLSRTPQHHSSLPLPEVQELTPLQGGETHERRKTPQPKRPHKKRKPHENGRKPVEKDKTMQHSSSFHSHRSQKERESPDNQKRESPVWTRSEVPKKATTHPNNTLHIENTSEERRRRQRRRSRAQTTADTLKLITSSISQSKLTEISIMKWRKIAEVVDRVLFWVFLFVTVTITFVILVVIPLCRRGMEDHSEFDISDYGFTYGGIMEGRS